VNYYSKNGELFNYNADNSFVVAGTQSKVFRLEKDVCLKLYNEEDANKSIFDDSGVKFNIEMFDYFKDGYGNTNMGKLYDLLYDEKIVTVLGYTMKYYEEMIENVLNLPVTYILDNFSLIYDLVMRLTDECIRVVDLHSGNIINTDSGIFVIDYDKYYFDRDTSKDILSYINRSALVFTFIGLLKNSLLKLGLDVDNDIELRKKILSLFTVGTTPLVLKYRLRSYNRTIDYFR